MSKKPKTALVKKMFMVGLIDRADLDVGDPDMRDILSDLQDQPCMLCDEQRDHIAPADLTCVVILEGKDVDVYCYICNECDEYDEADMLQRARAIWRMTGGELPFVH
jgi:hypothetical protein